MNSQQLKFLAMLYMIIDHIGLFLFPDVAIYRVIGRLAFPIYAFLIINTFNYTHNLDKKLIKITIFAIITQIVFMICRLNSLNIFFSMSFTLILMYLFKKSLYIGWLVAFGLMLLLNNYGFISTNYEIYFIITLYFYRKKEKLYKIYGFLLVLNIILFYNFDFGYIMPTLFGLYICKKYNGEYGGKQFQNIFYAFYPLHLLFLMIIKTLIL